MRDRRICVWELSKMMTIYLQGKQFNYCYSWPNFAMLFAMNRNTYNIHSYYMPNVIKRKVPKIPQRKI